MLLTAMQISLSKAARAPRPGEREFERVRRLGELTSNDILGGGAPEGYKVLSSQLWAPLGEVVGREVVEDDVEGDFEGPGVLERMFFAILVTGVSPRTSLTLDSASGDAVSVGACCLWVRLDKIETKLGIASRGAFIGAGGLHR